MTERDALMRNILESPHDDTARLVFADWLQETGRPRDAAQAELIRLQVARFHRMLAATVADTPLIDALGDMRREQAILRKWGAGWLPKTARFDIGVMPWDVSGDTATFRGESIATRYVFGRGLVSQIEIELSDGLPRGPETGAFLREALAHRPVERARISSHGFTPSLWLDFGPVPSTARRDWRARLQLVTGSEFDDPGAEELICHSRAALLAALPAWFDERLCEVEFERVVDDDFEEDGYEDDDFEEGHALGPIPF